MSLHDKIMNIQCIPDSRRDGMRDVSSAYIQSYKLGHRDARHAAAMLGNELEVQQYEKLIVHQKALHTLVDGYESVLNLLSEGGASNKAIEFILLEKVRQTKEILKDVDNHTLSM